MIIAIICFIAGFIICLHKDKLIEQCKKLKDLILPKD